MRIVVDLGCMKRKTQDSLPTLVAEYKPDVIFGFDPSPLLDTTVKQVMGVRVELEQKAAWTFDGEIPFYEMEGADCDSSHVGIGSLLVPCFDFSRWIRDEIGRCIVKMDIEGAEYPLLRKMIADGTTQLVDELLVEWHGPPMEVDCPTREWWM